MARLLPAILLFAAAICAPAGAAAQQPPAAEPPLEEFVREVARLWATADVAGLIDLLPAENRLVLDTGSGIETVNSRHAAAALRALFSERENVSALPVRVTVASSRPPRGFGELAWTFRLRGGPGDQSRSVYVAAVSERGSWKISELRLMP
jgi:hypothetical protein